tara:strand:+ start:1839 stop:2027 length:189 start_codon:yes stop_codon:yes gene_type:complete
VNLTTKDNFTQIIKLIEGYKEQKLETEITIYINKITSKKLIDLEEILQNRIKSTTDKGTIED